MRDEHDATIVICSHDMQEAEQLCDRIAILAKGRLVALDTVAGLKRRVGPALGTADPTLEAVFIHRTGRAIDEEQEQDEEVAAG